VDMLLRVARATVGASEVPANTNAGPYVERVLKGTGHGKGAPWCAAWVTDVGVQALGDQWPVRKTASVQQMADWAQAAKCRYVAAKAPAAVGDLFCLWFPSLKRYAHVGIVTEVAADGKTVKTVEGNTSGAGEREGWLVAERTRTLTSKDRLIRWVQVFPNP
jgi:CHAP domain